MFSSCNVFTLAAEGGSDAEVEESDKKKKKKDKKKKKKGEEEEEKEKKKKPVNKQVSFPFCVANKRIVLACGKLLCFVCHM